MTTLDQILDKPQTTTQDKPQTTSQPVMQSAAPPGNAQQPAGIIEQKQRNETMDDANKKLSNAAGAVMRKESAPTQVPSPTATSASSIEKPSLSYQDIIDIYYPQLTREELEKQQKKEKRDKLFASISDGISSLANLYFTTQYAPNSFNYSNSASKKTNDRWEKLKAMRDANLQAYINAKLRAKSYDDNYNDNERKWMRQLALDDDAQKRADADEKRKDAEEKRKQAAEQREEELAPLKKQLLDHQITQAKYKAEKDKIDAKYEGQLMRAKIASANRSNRGSSSQSGKTAEHQNAYKYWVSLSDKEKNQYRNWYKRSRKGKIGEEDGMPKYGTIYDKDDDNFIDAVWEYRKAYLRNQGREDEIATGGYNKKSIAGFGKGSSSGKQKLAGFGGN